jgi:Carboxypeptidase regulatory-like domain
MKGLQRVVLALGCCLALLALLSAGNTTFAQEVTATITGTVSDQSGAAIVGANVTARSVERGTTYTAVTNDAGIYRIPLLPVGNYDLRIEKTGFQTVLYPAFTLVLNQIARIDIQMKVGAVSQTIEVTGAAPILKTESTQVDTIINSTTNEALPLATRNYIELTLLSPGAVHPDPSSFTNGVGVQDANGNSSSRPMINGNREQSDNFLLDGMDNNQVSDNLVGYQPAPDAIEEFNMITQNAPAEFGNFMGGIISASIKSGTNSFHGDVWEFFRNNVLNANNWENKINPSSRIPTPPVRWNMFGGTLGGPIVKDKLFFFVDYQGQRLDFPPSGQFMTVFTPAEQTGNFSALLTSSSPTQIYNPCAAGTGVAGVPCKAAVANNATRPVFGGNTIPISMISPVAAALFASPLYPKVINSNLTNNALNEQGSQDNADQGDIRVDYKISDRDQVSGRFTRAEDIDPITNSQPLLGNALSTAPIWNVVGDWTRSISPTLVNDMRFGWNHIILVTGTTWDPSVGNFGESIGIANSNPAGLAGLLALGFNGGTPSSVGTGTYTNLGSSGVAQNFNTQVWQYNDSLTLIHGRHTFKLGGEYWFNSIKTFYSGNSGELGGLIFEPNFTATSAIKTASGVAPTGGSALADFFLGLPSAYGRGLDTGSWTQTTNVLAGFGQDTWRVSDHLTLTLGLRYEAHTPWVEQNDLQANYNIRLGEIQYANQNGASRSLYNGVYGAKDLQPRIGFAFTPGGRFAGKTVIRGAFTISDYLEGTGTNLRLPLNAPFNGGSPGSPEFQTLYTPVGSTSYGVPLTTASDGIIAPPNTGLACPNFSCYDGAVFRLWDSNVQPAIDDQYNLTIQHQFAPTMTFQIGYVGQVAYHLMVPFKYNQLVYNPGGTPSPSLYLQNGIGPQLAAAIDSTGGTISGTQSNGRMMYNSLQAVLQKTVGHGLQFQVSYTLSKCMTNNTGYYGTWSTNKQSSTASPYWQNVYDPAAEWSPCYYDALSNLTAYAVYALPFGDGRQFANNANKALNAVIGGWQVSPIVTVRSGFPLALYNNTGDPTGTFSGGIRPDCNGINTIYGRQNYTVTGGGGGFLWFNPNNYTNNTSGFGNCAPQIAQLRGPGYYDWDISLQKNFQITERYRLEFRTDFLNAFNAVNLAAPNTTVSQATTGVIQQAQPARNIQFALKLYY